MGKLSKVVEMPKAELCCPSSSMCGLYKAIKDDTLNEFSPKANK